MFLEKKQLTSIDCHKFNVHNNAAATNRKKKKQNIHHNELHAALISQMNAPMKYFAPMINKQIRISVIIMFCFDCINKIDTGKKKFKPVSINLTFINICRQT